MTGSSGPRLLVVDDDETFLEMLGWWLEHRGYAVTTCNNPRAARAAATAEVAAIVCDIELGEGVFGTTLVAELRHAIGRAVPAIFVSGYRAEFVPIDTGNGTDHFLQKPFDLAELADLVERCLS